MTKCLPSLKSDKSDNRNSHFPNFSNIYFDKFPVFLVQVQQSAALDITSKLHAFVRTKLSPHPQLSLSVECHLGLFWISWHCYRKLARNGIALLIMHKVSKDSDTASCIQVQTKQNHFLQIIFFTMLYGSYQV